MTSKERIQCTLRREEPDRIPVHDIVWRSTVDRWEKEGLPVFETEPQLEEYLGFEMVRFFPDTGPQFDREIIEQQGDYIIERNVFGEVVKNHKDFSTTPQILESPVKTQSEWMSFKKRLEPSNKRPVSCRAVTEKTKASEWPIELARCRQAQKSGKFILYGGLMGYDCIQRYVGSERLLMAIVTDPDWVKEMYMTQAKMIIAMYELMIDAGFHFDGVFVGNDMGYKNGPLFSPQHYKDQLFPADYLVCQYFREKDLPVIVHTDGDVKTFIPMFIEAGYSCLQPLEVKCGMDIKELKKEYGEHLSFMGGIDSRAMSDPNPNVLEEEIKSKLEIAKRGGGYIYHSDHSVPHDVSYQQYKQVLSLVEKYGRY